MKQFSIRDTILLFALILCSYALGEVSIIFSLWAVVVCPLVILLMASGVIFIFQRTKRQNIILSFLLLVGAIVGLIAGLTVSGNALSECEKSMPRVQEELKKYREEKGYYPESLGDLSISEPGRKILTGSTFKYFNEGLDYRLSYYDGLVEFVATESDSYAMK